MDAQQRVQVQETKMLAHRLIEPLYARAGKMIQYVCRCLCSAAFGAVSTGLASSDPVSIACCHHSFCTIDMSAIHCNMGAAATSFIHPALMFQQQVWQVGAVSFGASERAAVATSGDLLQALIKRFSSSHMPAFSQMKDVCICIP